LLPPAANSQLKLSLLICKLPNGADTQHGTNEFQCSQHSRAAAQVKPAAQAIPVDLLLTLFFYSFLCIPNDVQVTRLIFTVAAAAAALLVQGSPDSTCCGSSNQLSPFADAAQLVAISCYPHCTPAAAASGHDSHANLLTNLQQQQQMQQQTQSAGGELFPAVDDFLEALPGLDMHDKDIFDETDELLAHLLDLPPLPCLQQQQQQQQAVLPLPLPHSMTKADLCLVDLLLMP
jgi:hypothetical protein